MSVEQAVKRCYKGTTPKGFLYELSPDFPAFKGHFEKYPLLPAVCEISFCSDAAGRLLQSPVELKAVKRGKFINPVFPGMQVEIILTPRPDGWYLAELTDTKQHKKLCQIVLQFARRAQ